MNHDARLHPGAIAALQLNAERALLRQAAVDLARAGWRGTYGLDADLRCYFVRVERGHDRRHIQGRSVVDLVPSLQTLCPSLAWLTETPIRRRACIVQCGRNVNTLTPAIPNRSQAQTRQPRPDGGPKYGENTEIRPRVDFPASDVAGAFRVPLERRNNT